jgi:hypothetical protein
MVSNWVLSLTHWALLTSLSMMPLYRSTMTLLMVPLPRVQQQLTPLPQRQRFEAVAAARACHAIASCSYPHARAVQSCRLAWHCQPHGATAQVSSECLSSSSA